jgi:hypothetical protein
MMGRNEEEKEGESKYERLRCMAWNVNGWKGEKGKRKIRRIRGEVEGWDVFILTETHCEDNDQERAAFNAHFKDYHVYHVHAKEDGGKRLGVAIGVKKTRIEEEDIEIEREKDGEGGRWIVMTITGMMEKPLHIWGIYAPVKTALNRKQWMEKVGRKMKKKKGMRVIAGDFNFVMNTKLDKVGGNKKKGTEGRKEQKKWEEELEVVDAWRKFNPTTVATTWTSRDHRKEKIVKTRIDRALIDERLMDRTTETQIDRTTISDHDKITWTIETTREKTQAPYERVTTDMIDDEEYQKEVKKIYDEERGGGLEGYERFKKRCLEKAIEMKKKTKKRRGRDRHRLNTEIQKMRRIIEWTENARIAQEEGQTIKRWKRGMKMLRASNTMRWMGKQVGEITALAEVEEKAADHLDKLMEERDEGDGRKRRAEKNIEILREVQEEERGSKSFFSKLKRPHRREEIFALMEETVNKDTDEKIEIERTEKTDKERVATGFYKDLWKKRRVSQRVRQQMIEKISKRLTTIEKEELDKMLTMKEMKKTTKMMRKGKSTGIDGIPAEFYQKFEFVTEWLFELFKEMIERGEMTDTMKMSIVKILFKKHDKKRIENYRPISLLTADYKILAKILTERLKKVMTRLIGSEQQGFIPGGDIAGNLLLMKEIIAHCDEEEIEGAMIMMDFMKAYDRVDRETVMETMKAMNIGEGFRDMVRVLYAGSTARVVVNGVMGEKFRTEGGVRQGCPLSSLLFIIVLELMAIEMRESDEIEGIQRVEKANEGRGQEQGKARGGAAQRGAGHDGAPRPDIAGAEAEAGVEAEAGAGVEAGARVEAGGRAETEVEIEARARLEAGAGAEAGVEIATEAEAKAGAGAGAALEFDAGAARDSHNNNSHNNNNNNNNNQPTTTISSHSHRQKQKDTDDDRISMYADDSATYIQPDKTKKAREIISRYEKATAGQLHDGKTILAKLGITRQREMTNRQLGVTFRVMTEEDRENYLGDLIGHEMTEEERYGEILEKIEETGQKWNKERIGIYGQAIIANTILLSKISHRAQVNTLSAQTRKRLKEKFKDFIWKGARKGMVRWEVLLLGEEEGGVGLREPICALDAAKIRMFVGLMTKDRQPWMKWVERKLDRIARRWEVREAMAAKPSRKQLKELKEDCIVESTLKIWFEIGGKGGGKQKEEKKVKGEMKEIERSGMGVDEEKGGWTPIERMKTKQIYDRLIRKRMRLRDYTPKKAHTHVNEIQKQLSATERDYWWRLTHRVIQTKQRESHWKKDENENSETRTCPVCKVEEESWEHYDYKCKGVREMNERVAESMGRAQAFSRAEWSLEEEGMEKEMMLKIAKARWVYHCERVKMDMKQTKRLNTNTLMNRLNRRMEIVSQLM